MLAVKVEALPDRPVGRILVLRTAQTLQVQWALEELRATYPEAQFGLLGTQLGANTLFDGMEHFEPSESWLSPQSIKSLRQRLETRRFDMVVMCLNSDCAAGYGRASRVVRMINAPLKFVAGYNKRWHKWNHRDFEEGNALTRGVINGLGLLIYPVIAAYVLLSPSGPRYMPAGQGRPAPGYES